MNKEIIVCVILGVVLGLIVWYLFFYEDSSDSFIGLTAKCLKPPFLSKQFSDFNRSDSPHNCCPLDYNDLPDVRSLDCSTKDEVCKTIEENAKECSYNDPLAKHYGDLLEQMDIKSMKKDKQALDIYDTIDTDCMDNCERVFDMEKPWSKRHYLRGNWGNNVDGNTDELVAKYGYSPDGDRVKFRFIPNHKFLER